MIQTPHEILHICYLFSVRSFIRAFGKNIYGAAPDNCGTNIASGKTNDARCRLNIYLYTIS